MYLVIFKREDNKEQVISNQKTETFKNNYKMNEKFTKNFTVIFN